MGQDLRDVALAAAASSFALCFVDAGRFAWLGLEKAGDKISVLLSSLNILFNATLKGSQVLNCRILAKSIAVSSHMDAPFSAMWVHGSRRCAESLMPFTRPLDHKKVAHRCVGPTVHTGGLAPSIPQTCDAPFS